WPRDWSSDVCSSDLATMLFVFLYSLTPLSTSALFTAAAVARTRQGLLLPPFFVAKLISYLIVVWSVDKIAPESGDIWEATFSPRSEERRVGKECISW